jgi:hypothetical protein
MILYHYTSRHFAQEIHCTGKIKPNWFGWVYLSPTPYTGGAEAADRLSIREKAVELCCQVELPSKAVIGPSIVKRFRDSHGHVLRRGGGVEYRTRQEVAFGRSSPPRWTVLNAP